MGRLHPRSAVTMTTKARHREHSAVTMTTNPGRFVLIVSDAFILILNDA